MDYVELTGEVVVYIEENLKSPLSVEKLAGEFLVSRYYFARIFKAITGYAPTEYIRRRKISEAAKRIAGGDVRVLDVAMEYGFDSHEVFTRAFRRLTNENPVAVRSGQATVPPFERIELVDRDFRHRHSELIVAFEVETIGPLLLAGKTTSFDSNDPSSIAALTPFVVDFLSAHDSEGRLGSLYNLVIERPDGLYDYFVAGERGRLESESPTLLPMEVEPASYAVFRYRRDLGEIHTTVMNDICRTIVASGLELAHGTLSFFVLFSSDYHRSGEYRIYVPLAS